MEHGFSRKIFHVPSAWRDDADIGQLVDHRYVKSDTEEAFKTIYGVLKRKNYHSENSEMLHDYLNFMIRDFLDLNDRIYMVQEEFCRFPSIRSMLEGKTPDFLIQSVDSDREGAPVDFDAKKPTIMDVTTGDSANPYGKFSLIANILIVTPSTLQKLLPFMPAGNIKYIHDNFQLFSIEYTYWRAFIQFGRILLNEIPHIELMTLGMHDREGFLRRKTAFQLSLNSYADGVLWREGL